jgi:hypothetical protein
MSEHEGGHETGTSTKGGWRHTKAGRRELALATWLVGIFWYAVGVWAALALVERVIAPAWAKAGTGFLGFAVKAQGVLGLVLLAIGFGLVHLGWCAAWQWSRTAAAGEGAKAGGKGYPTPPTLQIGVGVFSFAALSLAAVIAMLHFGVSAMAREALLVTCAAGVGSSIATILGFLEHASEKEDFNPAYTPWYVGRPVMGLLLGLIFFFVIRGGMLGVLPNLENAPLNAYGLAAIGAMVGLFTKHAVEKLQEVFDVLFQTKDHAKAEVRDEVKKELLAKLPEPMRAQAQAVLNPKENGGQGGAQGT